MSIEELQSRIDSLADQLIEEGESVVIIISSPEGRSDELCYSYRGNYHTVVGSMEDLKNVCFASRITQCQKEWDE